MSESLSHMNFVNKIIEKVKTIINVSDYSSIKADTATTERPPKVGNHIPDVYFQNNQFLIIGEAKTINDLENEHCFSQFQAYLNECSLYTKQTIIIIAAPWQKAIFIKNYFLKIKTEQNLTTKVLIISENNITFQT